jgi:mono/diheme cytochrome c family protein
MANVLKAINGFALAISIAVAAVPSANGADDQFFRLQIAPILERRCIHCHGDSTRKGNLSLTTAFGAFKGGDGGPAVVPGKLGESLLLEMISGDKPAMPQKETPLSKEDVAGIRKWIETGASWPAGLTLSDRRLDGQRWWAFEPLESRKPPGPPSPWVRTPIDAFILAELKKHGLEPSPEADRRTLIRRLSFDLIGLPPTPEDVERFLDDRSPNAYESLVDRLLASPHYGERWGRHWLDVVHYGDTHGYDKDKRRDHAWPYRDYVIAALNRDLPYGRFIREQVAGDVLAPGKPAGVIAAGFIAAGPWDFVGHVELREGTIDKLKTRLLDRDDMVSSTISTFVSLTVHCARCHDHKFDPIPQSDYYRLQAVFAGVERGDRPYRNPEIATSRAALEEKRKAIAKRYAMVIQKIEGLSSPALTRLDPDLKRERHATITELAAIDSELGALPQADLVFSVQPHAPRQITVLRRGEVDQPGAAVLPGSLACMPFLPPSFALSNPDDEGSRRAALAEWLSSPKNVLTWRSIANRLWHYHFGRGIIETPNDFGRNGALPTHPELLDWLAIAIRDHGQSLKSLHRLIVCSAVYRQATHDNPAFAAIDAQNRFLWRQNRRRLDAEAVRDSVLAVSGALDRRMGGPGFEPFSFKDDHSPIYDHSDPTRIDGPQVRRRAIYRYIVRSVPNPFMEALDCADPNLNTPIRSQTLTALQALALWNDLFMLRQSQELARRVERQAADNRARVSAAFRLAITREPDRTELDSMAAYAQKRGLPSACRVLFNTNEFVFVD